MRAPPQPRTCTLSHRSWKTQFFAANVSDGSVASFWALRPDVGCTSNSDRNADIARRRRRANGCREQVQQKSAVEGQIYSITSLANASSFASAQAWVLLAVFMITKASFATCTTGRSLGFEGVARLGGFVLAA